MKIPFISAVVLCINLHATEFHILNSLKQTVAVYVLETHEYIESIPGHSEKTLEKELNNQRIFIKTTDIGTYVLWGVTRQVYGEMDKTVHLTFPSGQFFLGSGLEKE